MKIQNRYVNVTQRSDNRAKCSEWDFHFKQQGMIRRLIDYLKEKGKIKREGSNKFGCWIVVSMSRWMSA